MLTEAQVAIVKARLARGDKQQDIAAAMHINSGRIAEINTRKRFPDVAPATPEQLAASERALADHTVTFEIKLVDIKITVGPCVLTSPQEGG